MENLMIGLSLFAAVATVTAVILYSIGSLDA
jgi:hypothetical protein